ncbi:MAG TPA: integrin alpha, partial [Gemmatimonadales bacterium]
YGNDTGGANTGRAYAYYGGIVANAVADVTLTGTAPNDFFGYTVSGAGDVDGDGYDDVIVGAYANDAGGPDAGRAYVYYGGPMADAAADMTLTGTASGDLFGVSVSGARDVNGDGYGDVIVGASANDTGGPNAGRAYVYYGGPGADVVADLALTGAAAGDLFGNSVSGAGDVNGDGYPDVIVGANADDAGGLDVGRAYLHDFNRYFLTAPNGGETWNVGSMKTISWMGAEPADVWLSVDGGNTHQLVESKVGGSETNAIPIRVPHTPTKFARIKVTPSNTAISGFDRSDSLFTIQTSVGLLSLLAAALPQGQKGAVITWATDPGPEDLAGYKLEKAEGSRSDAWHTMVALTRETSYTDPSGGPGSRYRLIAVN